MAAKGKAEREARHGLATALRERVLKQIAVAVRDAMRGQVVLYERRPEKPLPAEVAAALREAEQICGIADKLTGENSGIMPFAKLLDERLRSVLYPLVDFAAIRREGRGGRRGSKSEAELLNATF